MVFATFGHVRLPFCMVFVAFWHVNLSFAWYLLHFGASNVHVGLSQAMTLADDPIIVQSSFKTRPLRDGGRKPSPSQRPPPLRAPSKLPTLAPLLWFPWHVLVPKRSSSPPTEGTGNTLSLQRCSLKRGVPRPRPPNPITRRRKRWQRANPST